MKSQKIFVIGDIHGCLDMLKRLMDKIDWGPGKDRLIFLGDYIDRGEDPKGVVDFILSLMRYSTEIECLIGNHEAMLLDYLTGRDKGLFLLNGGWSTMASYKADKPEGGNTLVPPDHMAFYHSLKTYIELEDYYIVHAGFRPNVELERQSVEDMVWIRDPFIYSNHDFGKNVIFGHTPFQEPLVMENKVGLDTGAVFDNRLTCLELPEFRFHSVKAEANRIV
ncbi:MAG: serine/threonine protein phosphatase [Deltaproteobacteria bacterium]|nr:serine/threonine protein phosphatase [Deltaproteobacteria bacterium]